MNTLINSLTILSLLYTANTMSLEFTRNYFPQWDISNPWESIFKNYISVELCVGSPDIQCLRLNLELNVYPLWIISNKSKTKSEQQASFNTENSHTFYLKNTFKFIFHYDKFETAYWSYDTVTLNKWSMVKDIYFLLVEDFHDLPLNSGVLGLDIQSRIYSDTPGSNWIDQIKKKNIIDNYAFSFIYDSYRSQTDDIWTIKDFENGKLLIGEYPHSYIKELENKVLIYEKVINLGNTLRWGLNIDAVSLNKVIIQHQVKVGFSVELGVIIGGWEFHEIVYNNYFRDQIEKSVCVKNIFKSEFFGYKCLKKVDLNKIDELEFKLGLHRFGFTKHDLFMEFDNDYIWYVIIFPIRNYLFAGVDWTFGAPFFKKNIVVFDNDRKQIGWYVDQATADHMNTLDEDDSFHFSWYTLLWICWFVILIIFCTAYYIHRKKMKKKKRFITHEYQMTK